MIGRSLLRNTPGFPKGKHVISTNVTFNYGDGRTGATFLTPCYAGANVTPGVPCKVLVAQHGSGVAGTDGLAHIGNGFWTAFQATPADWADFLILMPQEQTDADRWPLRLMYPALLRQAGQLWTIDWRNVHFAGSSRGALVHASYLALYHADLWASLSFLAGGVAPFNVDEANDPASRAAGTTANVYSASAAQFHLAHEQLATTFLARGISCWMSKGDADANVPVVPGLDGYITGTPPSGFDVQYLAQLMAADPHTELHMIAGGSHGDGTDRALDKSITGTVWATWVNARIRPTAGRV